MKRNLIYSVFAALLLASCSSDDIPAPAPAPETLDAYISLGITNGTVKTKADADADSEKNGDPAGTTAINSFTVAIFRGALSSTAASDGIVAPVTASEGALLYLNTFDLKKKETIGEGAEDANKLCVSNIVKSGTDYQINGIKIKGGNIHVLIMANMPKKLLDNMGGKTMDEIKALTYGNLAGEGFNNDGDSYPCSMTSKWLKYGVTPTENGDVFYLFNDNNAIKANETPQVSKADSDRTFADEDGDAIPLYRNVSAVGFQNIILDPADGWGKKGGATLTLKSVFVANAIGSTSMTAGKVPTEYTLYSGYEKPKKEGEEGTVNDGEVDPTNGALAANNTKMSRLNYSGFNGNEVKKELVSIDGTEASYYTSTDISKGHTSVGKYFMVYENSKEMNLKSDLETGSDQKTLLILCADYIYTDDLGFEHNLEDRYYAVVVNDKESSTSINGSGADNLVERNYIYKINLTIVGPGSINPYDPLYTANATAFVEAAPWTEAIDIDQDAE